ncbi:hypothetical protein MmmBen181_1059 [Mycoplasma mycoides subsp. mycoides]|nr:hypothetical protein MmmBen181_1059 [Mycoplasma mycoides subsp. mycoides]
MLKNFNPNNIIIFVLNSNKFSKKLKIAKYIESSFNVKYLSLWDEKQTIKYIIDYLKSKNKIIDINLASQIYNLLPNDLQIITNEINKLANLKSELNIDIIKTNLNKYHNEDIFKLVDAFINNNIDKFIKLYHDYILLNDDIIGLISLIDTNLSFYRDVVILKKQFKSEEQISTILKSHIYRVKLAVNNSYDINTLNDKIKIVYKIYKGIINWNINKKTLVEYMLIKNHERIRMKELYLKLLNLSLNILKIDKLKYFILKNEEFKLKYLNLINDILTLETNHNQSLDDKVFAKIFAKAFILITKPTTKQRFEVNDEITIEQIENNYKQLVSYIVKEFKVVKSKLVSENEQISEEIINQNAILTDQAISKIESRLSKQEQLKEQKTSENSQKNSNNN